MVSDPIFFRDLAAVLLAVAAGGALAWITRQPLILGYVLGGIVIGPFTPGPTISGSHTFELFAEIGVVLLMFSIGMEFSVKELMRVKWVALAGAPRGILLSVGLSMGAGSLIGWPAIQSIVIGAVISVSSTMVLARLLMDRGELRTRHGRVMIGITLVEDLAVVAMTVLLPVLGTLESEGVVLLGQTMGKSVVDPGTAWLRSLESHPTSHDACGQNPKSRTLPACGPGHRSGDCSRHTDGWVVSGFGGLRGRFDHQRFELWA